MFPLRPSSSSLTLAYVFLLTRLTANARRPLGSLKTKPSTGLHFLQMMKWSIMQYVVLRPASTLAAVITQAMGLYCVRPPLPLKALPAR
jgi:hypothetical protein